MEHIQSSYSSEIVIKSLIMDRVEWQRKIHVVEPNWYIKDL